MTLEERYLSLHFLVKCFPSLGLFCVFVSSVQCFCAKPVNRVVSLAMGLETDVLSAWNHTKDTVGAAISYFDLRN